MDSAPNGPEHDVAAGAAPAGEPPAAGFAPERSAGDGDVFAERPEIFVGAAFAGGLALAQLLRVLGR